MQVEIITKDDLRQFKTELLNDINAIVKPHKNAKEWLKSAEVRKMLNISPGTLQNLRIKGTLRYTKIGGMMYYKLEDITRLLEGSQRLQRQESKIRQLIIANGLNVWVQTVERWPPI